MLATRTIKTRKTGMKSSHYTTVVLPPCKICGGEATGFHFGVITCEACKAFFRRALVQKKPPKCKKNNQCIISSEKTGNCAACRLAKCRSNGMSTEGIRRGRFSLPLRTRAIVEANSLEGKPLHPAGNFPNIDHMNKPRNMTPIHQHHQNAMMPSQPHHSLHNTLMSPVKPTQAPIRHHQQQPYTHDLILSYYTNHNSNSNMSSISSSSSSGSQSSSPGSTTDEIVSSTTSLYPVEEGPTFRPSLTYTQLHPPALSYTDDDSEWTDARLSPDSTQTFTTLTNVRSLVPAFNFGSPGNSPTLHIAPDAGLGLVKTSEFEYLIDSLVNSQELVYPLLKKYFEQPLDSMHRDIYVEFNRKQEIFEDVFGASAPVSTAEYQQLFAETGIDLDERLHQFNMYGRAMEESIEQYMKFAELIPGFYKLAKTDVTRLAKAGHLEFWFIGSHMLFNKELGVAMCWDGSQNGTKEHMSKFFDKEWIDLNFEFADTLNKLKMSFEEIVLLRAIILTSADRGHLSERSHIHSLQERYFECLRYYLSKTCKNPTKRLYKLFDRLLQARSMTHVNISVNRKFLKEWGWVMQDYPLWKEMLAFDEL